MAITASCYVASPKLALIVGLLAGLWHNIVFNVLLHLRIDDPVGAFPVHTGCGVLGTFLVAFAYPHASLSGELLRQVAANAVSSHSRTCLRWWSVLGMGGATWGSTAEGFSCGFPSACGRVFHGCSHRPAKPKRE